MCAIVCLSACVCVCVYTQDRMETQVALLRAELERRDTEHREEMEALERKFLEDKSRVLKAHADSFQDTRRRAREEAQKQLDSDTKRIILDNKRMVRTLVAPPCRHTADCPRVCVCVCVCAGGGAAFPAE